MCRDYGRFSGVWAYAPIAIGHAASSALGVGSTPTLMPNDGLYDETVRLLRDVSANYHSATAIEDESGRPIMERQIAEVGLRAIAKLERDQGRDAAERAVEEAGAGWLGEEQLLSWERAHTGTDLRQKYCADCEEPAHVGSAAFGDWEKRVDDRGEEIVRCPDCARGSNEEPS
jgi:hypothetical protein